MVLEDAAPILGAGLEAAARGALAVAVATSASNYVVMWPAAAWLAADGARSAWTWWMDTYEENEDNGFKTLAVLVPALVCATYWAHGGLLLLLDVFKWPLLYKYKIQPEKQLDTSRLPGVLANILAGQVFLVWPLAVAVWYSGRIEVSARVPTFLEILAHMVVFLLVDEVFFYYGHRACHESRLLYKHIHKLHHQFTAPIGLAADYAHPVEHLFVNLLPNLAGALLVRAHALTYALWWIMTVVGTQCNHSGYRMWWLPEGEDNPNMHDLHHMKFTCNYGSMGVLDKLHGTYRDFREENEKTHKTM